MSNLQILKTARSDSNPAVLSPISDDFADVGVETAKPAPAAAVLDKIKDLIETLQDSVISLQRNNKLPEATAREYLCLRLGIIDSEILDFWQDCFSVAHGKTTAPPDELSIINADLISKLKSIANIKLTDRQYDVLACLSQGMATKQIARELDMAVGTVKVHLAGIYRAFGVDSRARVIAKLSELVNSPKFSESSNGQVDVPRVSASEIPVREAARLTA